MKRYTENGITLIELLIAIAITSIIGLGLVSMQYVLSQSQVAITKSYKNVDNANFTASQIVKEIRGARQSDNGAYFLATAGDSEIAFYSDVDLDEESEFVRYVLQGNNLVREVTEPTGYPPVYDPSNKLSTVFCDNIQNGTVPLFYYYNEQWPQDEINNPLSADNRLADTSTIKIYIKVNETDDVKRDYIVESFVQVRSVKDNL